MLYLYHLHLILLDDIFVKTLSLKLNLFLIESLSSKMLMEKFTIFL